MLSFLLFIATFRCLVVVPVADAIVPNSLSDSWLGRKMQDEDEVRHTQLPERGTLRMKEDLQAIEVIGEAAASTSEENPTVRQINTTEVIGIDVVEKEINTTEEELLQEVFNLEEEESTQIVGTTGGSSDEDLVIEQENTTDALNIETGNETIYITEEKSIQEELVETGGEGLVETAPPTDDEDTVETVTIELVSPKENATLTTQEESDGEELVDTVTPVEDEDTFENVTGETGKDGFVAEEAMASTEEGNLTTGQDIVEVDFSSGEELEGEGLFAVEVASSGENATEQEETTESLEGEGLLDAEVASSGANATEQEETTTESLEEEGLLDAEVVFSDKNATKEEESTESSEGEGLLDSEVLLSDKNATKQVEFEPKETILAQGAEEAEEDGTAQVMQIEQAVASPVPTTTPAVSAVQPTLKLVITSSAPPSDEPSLLPSIVLSRDTENNSEKNVVSGHVILVLKYTAGLMPKETIDHFEETCSAFFGRALGEARPAVTNVRAQVLEQEMSSEAGLAAAHTGQRRLTATTMTAMEERKERESLPFAPPLLRRSLQLRNTENAGNPDSRMPLIITTFVSGYFIGQDQRLNTVLKDIVSSNSSGFISELQNSRHLANQFFFRPVHTVEAIAPDQETLSPNNNPAMSVASIVGIVFGCILGILLVLVLLYYCSKPVFSHYKKYRNKKSRNYGSPPRGRNINKAESSVALSFGGTSRKYLEAVPSAGSIAWTDSAADSKASSSKSSLFQRFVQPKKEENTVNSSSGLNLAVSDVEVPDYEEGGMLPISSTGSDLARKHHNHKTSSFQDYGVSSEVSSETTPRDGNNFSDNRLVTDASVERDYSSNFSDTQLPLETDESIMTDSSSKFSDSRLRLGTDASIMTNSSSSAISMPLDAPSHIGHDTLSYAYSLEGNTVVPGQSASTSVLSPNHKLESNMKGMPESNMKETDVLGHDAGTMDFLYTDESSDDLVRKSFDNRSRRSLSTNTTDASNKPPMMKRQVVAPPGKLGIVIDTTLEGPVIHKVNKKSPLEGILFPGDIIASIDGVNTAAMSASAITALMVKTAARQRELTVLSEDAFK